MSQNVTQELLSGSTSGTPIQMSTAATTIHTPVTTTTTVVAFDQVWIYAANTDTVTHTLTLEWGTTNNDIVQDIPPKTTLLIAPGYPINGATPIKGKIETGTAVNVFGYINKIA